jgi:hypothetical protein
MSLIKMKDIELDVEIRLIFVILILIFVILILLSTSKTRLTLYGGIHEIGGETEGVKDIVTLPEYKIEIPNEKLIECMLGKKGYRG